MEEEERTRIIYLENPLEAFETLFDEEVFTFFQQLNSWKKLSKSKMYCYFGALLGMTIVHAPSIKDYWSRNTLLHNQFISQALPRDDFLKIHYGWHFFENKLKVKGLEELINRKLKKDWTPGNHIAIDESMIPFKGRSRFKVNIPRKPVDEGIKVWVVADSKLWVYHFEIDMVEKEEREKMKKISQKTLIRLAQTLPTKKFLIYSDSYFGGAETAKELTKLGFNICLSCTSIRPSWLFTKFLHRYLKVGQWQSAIVEFNQDKWLCATTFLQKKKSGKKYFNLISNCETDSLVEIKKTIYLKKEKKEKVIKKPANILDYRNHLGYVDSFNQRTNTYWFPHKTQSWKKKIII